MLAPIVLFVYNRPWHTLQTLEALSKNNLASQSSLFIYADGPKAGVAHEQLDKINEVREIAKSKQWCGKVKVIERNENMGLADNIVSGVTEIVNQFGKVIVLEDDLVTSPGFLQYMNDALKFYEDEERVMHVSGYMFPVKKKLPETFFYNTASCWGWGTWSRVWRFFNSDAKHLLKCLRERELMSIFNIEDTYPFEDQLISNISGERKTWAVKWYASFLLNGGLSLHPYPSLVNNIGHDGAGENCGTTSAFHWKKLACEINVKPILLEENTKARKAMQQFNLRLTNKSKVHRCKEYLVSLAKYGLSPIFIDVAKKLLRPEKEKNKQLKLALKKLKQHPRYETGETNILGSTFKYVDSASFKFIYEEVFEKEIYKFNADTESPYIIDAGANIGLSVLYFKKMYPKAKVIAFEPDEVVYNVLKYNVDSFLLPDVTVIKKGLWGTETSLQFFSEGADAGRISTNKDIGNLVEIPTTVLSQYLDKDVDFLKIDIEGAEYEVLNESKAYLKNVKNIFVEYHSFTNTHQELHNLLGILSDAGFRYNIHHIGIFSSQPFMKINSYMNMDLQLNIYGYRQ